MTCVALSLISYLGHFDDFGSEHSIPQKGPYHDQVDESFFKDVTYYSLENSKPFLELQSIELSISSVDGVVIGFNPKGVVYRYEKDNRTLEPIFFQARNSRALLKKKEIFLENT